MSEPDPDTTQGGEGSVPPGRVAEIVHKVTRSDADGDPARFDGQIVKRAWQR